jgi:hypothetical protein
VKVLIFPIAVLTLITNTPCVPEKEVEFGGRRRMDASAKGPSSFLVCEHLVGVVNGNCITKHCGDMT